MENTESAVSKTLCSCNDLIQLTRQTELDKLNSCLLDQINKLIPGIEAQLVKYQDNDSYTAKSPNTTQFNLSIAEKILGKLIISTKTDESVNSKIASLCEVYVNQVKMIQRINHDQLTKLGNRQALESKFTELLEFNEQYNRRRKTLVKDNCVAIFDIDHFKRVNDNYGHLYGDEVLLQLSQLMASTFRNEDALFRYGGEEFVVILSDVKLNQAEKIFERFRVLVEQYDFPIVNNITISIGLTQLDNNSSETEILGRADKALYYAKENGRNQIHTFESLLSDGKIQRSDSHDDDITLF